jgi:hypothetical protein
MKVYAGTVTHRALAVTFQKTTVAIGASIRASWHLKRSVQEGRSAATTERIQQEAAPR